MADEVQGAPAPATTPPPEAVAAFQLAASQEATPAQKPESLFERIEDEVIKVAEEAAYSFSNLIAAAQNRKPDDGIDAWRKRTGGLHRHPDSPKTSA